MKLAVIGAGIMGTNHARLAGNIRDLELVWIVDPDLERAATVADRHGAQPTQTLSDVLSSVDAAIVATPTAVHREVAIALMEGGVDVLVEKPLAASIEDAAAIVEVAHHEDRVLMVGHVERFNPAVLALELPMAGVIHVAAQRVSPFLERVRDDVVIDLMIHDLDIVRAIAAAPVTAVHASGRSARGEVLDLATALVEFDNGVLATLTASRVGQQKIRTLEVTQRDRFVSVDLVRQDVTINRVEHSEFLASEGARYRQTGVVEIPFLEHRGEPLELELREFVRAVSTRTPAAVSGSDALETLRLVDAVRDAIAG